MWLKFWKLLILAGSVSFLLVSRGLKRRLSAIFDFKKISNFVTLGMVLFYSCLDHPWTVFGYFYHCAKFNWNPCCSFHKIQVLIFYRMLIHAPKMGRLGDLTLQKGSSRIETPKRNLLAWTQAGCDPKKSKRSPEKPKYVTSHMLVQTINVLRWICVCSHARDVVIYTKFHQNPFRGFGSTGVEIWRFPLLCLLAFTVACTII